MWLKRLCILFVLCALDVSVSFAQNVFDSDYVGPEREFYSDVIIRPGVLFAPDAMYAMGEIVVENHGLLKSNVFVKDRCSLRIENFGIIDANFVLGADSKIIQMISGSNSLNSVDFGNDYTVHVLSDDLLSLADVINTVHGADKIFIEDSILSLNRMSDNYAINVELGENVVFIINGEYDYSGAKPLLENVSGGYGVRFVSENSDVLYSNFGYIKDGKLFVERVRETDYVKIFNNDTGRFLNGLRYKNPNNLLLQQMDSATTMEQLNNVMGKSVLFNPNVLFKPLKTINVFDELDRHSVDNTVHVSGDFMFSDDFDLQSLELNVGARLFDGLALSIGGRIANMKYESDYDVFDADVYGLNIGIDYDVVGGVFLRADVGYSTAIFDIDTVVYNDVVINEPHANFGFVMSDVGYDFNLVNNIYVSGFVGGGYEFYKTGDSKVSEMRLRVGADIGYVYDMMGVRYDYSVRAVSYMNDVISVTGRIGVWSEFDAFGGYVDVGVLYQDGVPAYKLSVNGKIAF